MFKRQKYNSASKGKKLSNSKTNSEKLKSSMMKKYITKNGLVATLNANNSMNKLPNWKNKIKNFTPKPKRKNKKEMLSRKESQNSKK